jgi:hypothetical protein
MKERIAKSLLLLPLLAVLSTPLWAQGTSKFGYRGWGVRAGLSNNPDQVYGGVHWDLGEFAKNVRFRPNVEVGFGDNVNLIMGNAEVHYVFSQVQVWKPYVGGSTGFLHRRQVRLHGQRAGLQGGRRLDLEVAGRPPPRRRASGPVRTRGGRWQPWAGSCSRR